MNTLSQLKISIISANKTINGLGVDARNKAAIRYRETYKPKLIPWFGKRRGEKVRYDLIINFEKGPVAHQLLVKAAEKNNTNFIIKQLSDIPKNRDVLLILMSCFREWGGTLVNKKGDIDTFYQGGLDFLSKARFKFFIRKGYLKNRKEYKKLHFYSSQSPETKKMVYPIANFPRKHLIELYGAYTGWLHDRVLSIWALKGQKDLDKSALRFWILFMFIAPGWAKYCVRILKAKNLKYTSILNTATRELLLTRIKESSQGTIRLTVARWIETHYLEEMLKWNFYTK